MLDPNKMNYHELQRRSMILKGFVEGDDLIEKGKKMPIGTISNGRKKVAEGKWVPVKNDNQNQQKTSKTHKDASNHIVENEDGTIDIDVLDPDTEAKVFKEGDSIVFKDSTGKKHSGVVGKSKGDHIHSVKRTKQKVKQPSITNQDQLEDAFIKMKELAAEKMHIDIDDEDEVEEVEDDLNRLAEDLFEEKYGKSFDDYEDEFN